jgi:hypothetical protein
MSDAMIDFASLDSAAADTTVDTTVDTSAADTTTDSTVDAATTDSAETAVDSTEGKETETHKADGSERTPEEVEEFKKTAAAKVASDKELEGTPANVRSALKTLKADPKNAAVVKELHGSYERWQAAKQIFPKGVAEMTEAKAFIDSVGGPEGYQKSQDMIEAVLATDELLYAADARLWDNVIEDLKSSGHPEALGQLAPSFLAKLKVTDSDAFYNTTIPVVAEAMKEIHMDSFVKQFNEAINEKDSTGKVTPNVAKVTELIKGLTDWYTDLDKDAKARTAAPADTPERKKFLAEKAEFEKTKTTAAAEERKKTELGIAEECDKHNNRSLGKVLGGFLKMPFFKDFPYETKVDLGNGIKDRLYAALKADKAYQTQMAAMWKSKTPDRAKMLQYHQAKVDSIATDIVTKTIQNRYPGYAKGGSSAGKAAVVAAKKVDATKAAAASVSTNKPIYVATRPENLIREPLKVGGRDYSTSDLITLQISGKGFVKTTDGKGVKFVTWRKS